MPRWFGALRDVAQKNGKMWEFFPSGGPPLPLFGMTRFEKWKWDSGRPPPVFSSHIFLFIFLGGGASLFIFFKGSVHYRQQQCDYAVKVKVKMQPV